MIYDDDGCLHVRCRVYLIAIYERRCNCRGRHLDFLTLTLIPPFVSN